MTNHCLLASSHTFADVLRQEKGNVPWSDEEASAGLGPSAGKEST